MRVRIVDTERGPEVISQEDMPQAPVKRARLSPEEVAAIIAESSSTDVPSLKRAFLAAFTATGNIALSLKVAGITRGQHEDWKDLDTDYKIEFGYAQKDAADALEAEARRRAVDGVKKYKFHQGSLVMMPHPQGLTKTEKRHKPDPSGELVIKEVQRFQRGKIVTVKVAEPVMVEYEVEVPIMVPYEEHEYSDQLLALLLRANNPDKFGNNAIPEGAVAAKFYQNVQPADFGSEIGEQAVPTDRGGSGSVEV